MIDDWFHRTARDFRWDMHRPVSDGKMLYAYYTFSYVSLLPEANGKRVGFEGVSMMKLRDGKIADYSEVANVGPAFVELGFAPERTAKILAKEGAHLKKQAGTPEDLTQEPREARRLEGWDTPRLPAILRDAPLRGAPQDEVVAYPL